MFVLLGVRGGWGGTDLLLGIQKVLEMGVDSNRPQRQLLFWAHLTVEHLYLVQLQDALGTGEVLQMLPEGDQA